MSDACIIYPEPTEKPNDFYCPACGAFSSYAPVVIEPGNEINVVCVYCGAPSAVRFVFKVEFEQ